MASLYYGMFFITIIVLEIGFEANNFIEDVGVGIFVVKELL